MKQSLQLRTSQHLALTPQLQQSIRLLQLSTLELHQELEQILSDNPLLERLDDALDNSVRLLADGAISGTPATQAEAADTVVSSSPGEAESPDGSEALGGDEQGSGDAEWSFDDVARSGKSSDDEDARPQLEAHNVTLREHLLEQARLTIRSLRDRALVELLIDALDEQGYLEESLEEIHGRLPHELEIDIDELSIALKLLQSFEPAGVGARSASESLALQVKRLDKVPFVTRRLALTIVEDYLSLFAQRDFNKIRKAIGCDDEDLREAQAVIRRCDPHPGSAFSSGAADYVVPDVIVKATKDGWQVLLNHDVMPRLRVNAMYANALKQSKGDGSLGSQLQEAKWLIKNMRQRFDTILRVAQAIVERQRNFFSHGAVAMRPLVLREIADTLGLHESTISRVTTQKYMLTPHGMFELKYFFGSHVATEAGGEASSTAIRALIKQLIGAEDPKSPLSDSKIADMLAEQGMVVARRTVAKYREVLKIPPVNLRKSL
ncbi:RNA polymerase sigma-54 factor [Herbaspirillum sp. Sphag1AN]|uniref:RNA polymerase factor sigma-54 n=1 Tax=unclassified Herbaspirillum TaxID=2624150 RepID=UPI00160A0733|nr:MULTISPECIES: RNA polymerase factor sigma-54 [unclassified Herbaspirillum]MBB3212719.1 RNA polymerase sigma-54 factor [Herbaspirillum sp. Sphag1AN]MBB3245916.1 RNA polymerase sigma-54 factor [Herbaspirillum sp. Sphag64]